MWYKNSEDSLRRRLNYLIQIFKVTSVHGCTVWLKHWSFNSIRQSCLYVSELSNNFKWRTCFKFLQNLSILQMSIRQASSVGEIQHKSPEARCAQAGLTQKSDSLVQSEEFSSWYRRQTQCSRKQQVKCNKPIFSPDSAFPHTQALWKKTVIFRCLYDFIASQVPLQWQQQISSHLLTNIFWRQNDHKIQFLSLKLYNPSVWEHFVGFFSEDVKAI